MGPPPSRSDRNSKLSLVAATQCSTAQEISNPARHKEIGAHDPPYSRNLEAHQDHLGLEVAALRALLIKTQEDLTAAQTREKRARYLAFHDDLTSLPNRRFFRERLDFALRSDGVGIPSLAVLYLDLDGFKALNDLYGHDTGDALLSAVARRLSHALRAEDLVSRLAGDEYACLISGVSNRERLQQLAATLFHAVSAPFKIGTLELTVRPSIGIAVCPGDGSTTDELMRAADSAMYMAKRQKSSYAFFGTPRRGPAETHRHEQAAGQLTCVGHRTDLRREIDVEGNDGFIQHRIDVRKPPP
jgi:diguanylate cyclase (GGDEF)-like protein